MRPGKLGKKMEFEATPISGAYLVSMNKIEDERGFFARLFCQSEFKNQGLADQVIQANLSHNTDSGTLRGMHYQTSPALETKLVRCIRGAILDVIVDMRPQSASYRKHYAVELNENSDTALFVPAMCAHGFQTLEPNTDVFYMVSGEYHPDYERGLRHDDPALGLNWPCPIDHISDKDQQWPLLTD
ncbi:dTDP-4-dehydrorhamnose 3,5-epimerase family protein [Granulosicoccus sp.]|nr:dTDP-4-dehydrorhamnose 3,5-epimerase family protein [Granulosicoccus sp.]MDB4223623.1 dTDP-4-dehydrorhamnose 3,5-epimerase family protein [Granulosicoccus sp.]